MKGKDFEKIIVERNREYRQHGTASVGRYGVQAARTNDEWIIMQSLPDFEGTLAPNGNQVIFDCKVCSQASMPLSPYREESKGSRRRQLRHMLDRSRFGAICFFLIHWPERELKTRTEPVMTWRFPVDVDSDFWRAFEAGEVKTLSRSDCEDHGDPIDWVTLGDGRTPRPDYLNGIVDTKRKGGFGHGWATETDEDQNEETGRAGDGD